MTLFHGSTNKVSEPVISFGKANLDFGQGFYLTDLKEQAISWAKRQADARKAPPVLNIYEFEKENAVTESDICISKHTTGTGSISSLTAETGLSRGKIMTSLKEE